MLITEQYSRIEDKINKCEDVVGNIISKLPVLRNLPERNASIPHHIEDDMDTILNRLSNIQNTIEILERIDG